MLGGLIDALVTVGDTMLTMLPCLLLGGPLGLAVALIFALLILTILALIFHVFGEILGLLVDGFDHYQGDRPTAGHYNDRFN